MQPEPFKSPVTEYLERNGIPFRTFTHPGKINSLEQAAAERGQTIDQVVRSILFRITQDEYVMVLIAGARQVSWPVLRQFLGKSRISMASENEVVNITGYSIGAVSPFGLKQPVRILLDTSVLEPEEISIGSGQRGTTVILRQEHFRIALGAFKVYAFAQSNPG